AAPAQICSQFAHLSSRLPGLGLPTALDCVCSAPTRKVFIGTVLRTKGSTTMHNAPSTVRSAREEQLAIERLLAQSELLPLLPMIYVAWADGELEDEEIARVVEQATRLNWLDTKAATMLADWLDPSSPLSPAQLQML